MSERGILSLSIPTSACSWVVICRRREGTEAFAVCDPQVERLLHGRAARVAQDRARAERARTELHASLEPADRAAGRKRIGRLADERAVVAPLEVCTRGGQSLLDLALLVARTEVAALHGVVAVGEPRLAGVHVIGGERRADRAAGVARRRLDPHALETAVAQNLAVADAIERDAAGQAEVA